MEWYYISHSRMPTERAHGFQIMAMCEAFASAGMRVTLLVPNRTTLITEDVFSYYHIARTFVIKKLGSWDSNAGRKMFPKFFYWMGASSFALSTLYYVLTHQRGIVFSRDVVSSFLLAIFGFEVVFEVHDAPVSGLYRILFKKARLLVVTNALKKDLLIKDWHVPEEKIMVAHHGVNAHNVALSKEACRAQLGIPQEKMVVVYTGHLYEQKGVYTLFEAASLLPDTYEIVVVGGTPEGIAQAKKYISEKEINHVTLVGNVPHPQIPLYLQAADILTIPSSGKFSHGALESSPLKLFEYLASGKPIVASDLPAIREAAGENELLYVEPDNTIAFAHAFQNISPTSQRRVHLVSWKERAEAIVTRVCQHSKTLSEEQAHLP